MALDITFVGIKPNGKCFDFSVVNNAKVDVINFVLTTPLDSVYTLKQLNEFNAYVKVQSAGGDYIDKISATSTYDSENEKLTVSFVLHKKTTAYKNIALQLQFEDLQNEVISQTEIVALSLKGTINADKEISDKYPEAIQELEKAVENKQDKLIAGNGIKIENNIISAEVDAPIWGNIGGNIAEQEDLQNELGGIRESVSDEKDRAELAENELNDRISNIDDLIPSQASEQNKLADKDFVNSSIATNTAYFKGTYNVVSDLGLAINATHEQIATALGNKISDPTNNDYVFVSFPDPIAPSEYTKFSRYKYNSDTEIWAFEFDLNNSSFTAEQWASINSGITSGKVATYDSHIADKNNPHEVTKQQVGLGNVDNTSDADKPVSNATQIALDEKADKNDTYTKQQVDALIDNLKRTISIDCLAPVGDTTDLSGITIQVKDDSDVVIASGVYNETTLTLSLPLNQKYKVEILTNSVSIGGITYFAPDKESGQDEGTLTENITLVYRYASTENINSLRAVKQFIAMPDIDLETKRQALVRSETNSFSVDITVSNPDNPSQTYTMPLYVLAVDTYTKLVNGVEQSFLGARIQFGYALPDNYVFDEREQAQCDDGETFQSGIYYYTATSSGIGDKAFTPLTEGTDYQVGDSIDTYETTNNVFVFKHAWSNTQYGSGGSSTSNLIRYGSNIIHESNLMKWLNGSGTSWFVASHLGDRLANQYVGKHGFKDWFSASDLALIEDMVGYGVYERTNFELPNNKFYSMFNLLSGTEIAGSVNANEGTAFDYWKYLNGGVISNNANANRTVCKITNITSKQTFWLRSPYRGNSSNVWYVNIYGIVSTNNACNSYAVLPTFTV